MTNVVCVNVGTKYPKEYTECLYNMVKRNTTKDFTFYVLTDNEDVYADPINPIIYKENDIGWWCKMGLYKPGVLPSGEYLYFDLDVVIVDNIDCFFDHPSFGITRDFIRPDNGLLPGKEYNSSILRFNSEECEGIWQYYYDNKDYWHNFQKQIHFFGDQNVVSSYLNHYPEFLSAFPDEWCWSYKKGVHRGKTAGDRSQMFGRKIPKGGKIAVFHGNPNPLEVTNVDWVKEYYR